MDEGLRSLQKAKVHVHTKSLLERLPAPSKRFSYIHIDLVGPLNPVLIRRWIAMWGFPDVITSDRGPHFVSDLWIEMCKLMGIARNTTTSYHPQNNGKIERMHRCLNISLHARLLGIQTGWQSYRG